MKINKIDSDFKLNDYLHLIKDNNNKIDIIVNYDQYFVDYKVWKEFLDIIFPIIE